MRNSIRLITGMLTGVATLLTAVVATSQQARAQSAVEPPFYRVYEYETPLKGWQEPTLWNTYVPSSKIKERHYGKEVRREGLFAHSLEFEQGVDDRRSVALYLDFENSHDIGFKFIRGRVEGRWRLGQQHERFWDTALYAEYDLPMHDFSDPQEIETRLIFQHDFEDTRLVLNPILTKETSGDEAGKGPTVGLATKLYKRRNYGLQPGLELYDTWAQRNGQHILFPTVDVHWKQTHTWNIGVGFGLTHSSDKLVIKSVLRWEFPSAPPPDVFGH